MLLKGPVSSLRADTHLGAWNAALINLTCPVCPWFITYNPTEKHKETELKGLATNSFRA